MKNKLPSIRTFRTFEDDFVSTADQNHELPKDYSYLDEKRSQKIARAVLHAVAYPPARLYLAAKLDWRTENRNVLRKIDTGAVIFCNHTQPIGDALAPLVLAFPRRAFVVASPANLGIPLLGKMLPLLGALPVPSTIAGMKRFRAAVAKRLDEGAFVFVYPEAHVWPWYTGIRPLPDASFAFAIDNNVPAYCLTSTYQARRFRAKPRLTAIVDGPFDMPEHSRKKARSALRDEIEGCMRRRAAERSTCSYVVYKQEDTEAIA